MQQSLVLAQAVRVIRRGQEPVLANISTASGAYHHQFRIDTIEGGIIVGKEEDATNTTLIFINNVETLEFV